MKRKRKKKLSRRIVNARKKARELLAKAEAEAAKAGGDKGGRPKIELDPKAVQVLCEAQLTNEEIAACLGCSAATIARAFGDQLKHWKAAGVGSVKRALFITAVRPGAHNLPSQKFYLTNFGQMTDDLNVNLNDVRARLFEKLGGDLSSAAEPGTQSPSATALGD